MSDKQMMIIASPVHRERAVQMVRHAPDGFIVEVKPKTRSLEQNRMLWACLDDVAKHFSVVGWYGRHNLTRENWKDIFSASLKKMDVATNIDGSGFVALGQSTRDMNKREFCDLINLIHAFGAGHGVQWSDDASDVYAQWLEKVE